MKFDETQTFFLPTAGLGNPALEGCEEEAGGEVQPGEGTRAAFACANRAARRPLEHHRNGVPQFVRGTAVLARVCGQGSPSLHESLSRH